MSAALRLTIRILASVALVAAIVVVYVRFLPVNGTTVALTMLLAILGIATRWGLTESLVASVAAVLGFNYFFLPPIRTFTITDPTELGGAGRFPHHSRHRKPTLHKGAPAYRGGGCPASRGRETVRAWPGHAVERQRSH